MMIAPALLDYVLDGVASTPAVMSAILGQNDPTDSRWDARPDPGRFTLREMVAHVADWDEIYMARVHRTLTEDNPVLENMDEGQLAIDRDYANQDPLANLARLADSRPRLVAALRAVVGDQWDRTAHRETVGDITLFQLAVMILGHDAYHLRQAAEYFQGGNA